MDSACYCKGKRTCLLCEKSLNKKPRDFYKEFQEKDSFVYCLSCQKIFKGWNIFKTCADHDGSFGRCFPGIYIQQDFLSHDEANDLVADVDKFMGWEASQSGRRKKNFGPKVNFKKKKLSLGKFMGFSTKTNFVRENFKKVPLLLDFVTIEECFLEYEKARGSSIEPHVDDCWIWGERVVTVNCLGDSVLTLTKHKASYPSQYNIDMIEEYKDQLICPLHESIADNFLVRIPMPQRSLLIIYGSPRYQFEHSVLREDISSRRVAIAYREFTIPYQKNNYKHREAKEIYKICEPTVCDE